MRILYIILLIVGLALVALQIYADFDFLTDDSGKHAVSEDYGPRELAWLWIGRHALLIASIPILLSAFWIRRILNRRTRAKAINQFLK